MGSAARLHFLDHGHELIGGLQPDRLSQDFALIPHNSRVLISLGTGTGFDGGAKLG
jgi:hypothetical protein